ncbi:bifunctional phosphoribosylaminoimidazolecarboxamide formyltransferase/IMP cyclohydrolase [Bifidobacterium pseudolongum subsp. globosum]|uniref:bifunctional phosphoribosylaminoimidazolecarboxamide formyltransferase/IMP cyclohydrolase n=1 Tax=Bifidobacterium pseudolongum TaxID=1694 RepID=UPI000BA95396|nr:bifunctional phosphoribosylaminoimidazolecarboxamide formyltransferase/IMP cyclohydrolase [Bifidobacterium pseudolongum]MCI1194036.1 bifunctional phosphoribosylaminoimidazolecarboxamide formyltransferase/IMP cyclohydrolase [Bifidobacterium pseudolongum subsp. globosum]UNP92280.1 bifunctional phosphoribosylaminoimidazolecarboxamide formyltransferase/IMP cyclohydrolase [Bifidobacterium pseudolongum subsp. globosum]UNZ08886.1 bifunctional phosphoribosylaminoimidazolecarboxamide formyltransferase
MTTNRPLRRALVSVYHKEGIEVLAQAFIQAGTEVVSTGSTAAKLKELGVQVTEVSQVTGFPECLDGRVKTLDPHIHAGILADMTNPDHAQQLESFGIKPFDLVVVNLYPFADTVRSGADNAAIIEKIDIGGPSMVRGAAKNSATVAIVTDPTDYALVAGRIADGTGFSLDERRWLAGKAFAHTAAYDATINEWTSAHWPKPASIEDNSEGADAMEEAKLKQFPQTYTRSWDRAHVLRYGENPHQDAALYLDPLNTRGFANAEQLGGKPMSYNNYVDADAAWRAVWDFAPQIAVAVVKHNNPCGLAVAATAAEAHRKAHACDPMSAYGGVIATNSTVTLDMAQSVRPIFTEVIVAPDYEPEALALLQEKKKNLRILKVAEPPKSKLQFRQIDGGLLVQSTDLIDATGDMPDAWKLVAGEAADEQTLKELEFAWRAVRCVKSNAILIADDLATVGIGMGQVNRVDSANLAVERANTLDEGRNRTQGAVAASDAFFPFADGAQILIDAGVKAIVQPGGSIRDEEVFEAARKANVTMYVTGTRHFFH